jgi:hypothetical protein
MITEIRINSIWEALEDFNLGIGSHSQNPNSKSLLIKRGTILVWDEDSPSGNVWFNVEIDGVKHRGKKESGCILNLVSRDLIQLVDNGRGFVIYPQEYVKRYLND